MSHTEDQNYSLPGLVDRSVLVVGGTRGIGFAIAQSFARCGSKVGITGRDLLNTEAIATTLSSDGRTVRGFAFNLNDSRNSADLMKRVEGEIGPLDICVLNAGINPYFEPATRVSRDHWDELANINLSAPFFVAQSAANGMLDRRHGSIVFISSVTSEKGALRGLPYVAMKGAVNATVKTLALEWAPLGVRVNAVSPGYISTDMTEGLRDHDSLSQLILSKIPMGRFGTTEEVAGIVAMLCSDLGSYVTGHVLAVDGGYLVS